MFSLLATQGAILALYLVLMARYVWPEEALLLYLLPAVLVLPLALLTHAVIRRFRRNRFGTTARRSLVLVAALQVLLLGVLVWSATPRHHQRQQVLADLDYGLRLMEDMHPDLYAVTDRDSVQALIASLARQLPDRMSEVESQKFVSTVVASLHDAHTMVDLDNYLNRGSILFRKVPPCRFRILGDHIYVRENYYWRHRIPVGSEIIEINGRPSLEVMNDVGRMISHETAGSRDAWLEYPLFWGWWNNGRDFELTCVAPDGSRQTVTTGSGLIANVSYLLDMAGGQLRFGSFKRLDGNIGYLDLKAFQGGDQFTEFLRQTFQEIRQEQVRNLIIDLRENSGGMTNLATELMQYVAPVEFRVFDSSVVKVSEELLTAWSLDRSQYQAGDLVEEAEGPEQLRDNPLRYDGRCYVLTDGTTFSTALDFAAMVRCYGVGEIIGTATGGRTTSFGSPYHFELPATGLKLKVSIKSFVNACGGDNGGVIRPDHVVANTVADDMRGVDRALAYTVDLIGRQ